MRVLAFIGGFNLYHAIHDLGKHHLNLQPKGSQAKPYQVIQVRKVILRHKLAGKVHDGE